MGLLGFGPVRPHDEVWLLWERRREILVDIKGNVFLFTNGFLPLC